MKVDQLGAASRSLSPPGSAGEVAVTVHTEAGTSVASKKTVFKYKATKAKKG